MEFYSPVFNYANPEGSQHIFTFSDLEYTNYFQISLPFISFDEYGKTWVALTFWRRNYFFLILAHPVYKIWIIQEPNMLELWNKLHFEEEKTESIYYV